MTSLLRASALALALLAPLAASGQAPALKQIEAPSGGYKLDLSHASVTFRVKHLGLSNYTARFAKFDSTVDYDAKDPTRSKLTVVIDPKSIRTDFPEPAKEDFDKVLGTDEKWLAGDKHPEIRFVSTGIRRTGPNSGQITGDLSFRGVTKPVTLAATWNGAIEHPFRKKPVFGVSAKGTIKRSEFGMTNYIPMIGDDVELQIEAEYTQQ